MTTLEKPDSLSRNQWNYTIFLVDFSESEAGDESDVTRTPLLVSELIDQLVPEARVLSYSVFGNDATDRNTFLQKSDPRGSYDHTAEILATSPSAVSGMTMNTLAGDPTVVDTRHPGGDDAASIATTASTAFQDSFWSASIEKEALALLGFIHRNIPDDEDGSRHKILLAGYGFGGIIVKEAVVLANTTPAYYGIAYSTSKLVFFSTPHRSDEKREWEEVLMDMIRASKTSLTGRLSQIFSALVSSVSQLSHVFYRFAAKYPISNFIEGQGISLDHPVIGKLGKFDTDFEDVVVRQESNFKTMLRCREDSLDDLELLRFHFSLVQNGDDGNPLAYMTEAEKRNAYFGAMQTFSQSHWIVDEIKALQQYEDFINLKETYNSLLDKVAFNSTHEANCIQVIGPSGCGKTAVLKVIVQEALQKSRIIVLDSRHPATGHVPTLYRLLGSYVHQILSQQPSLFHLVINMVTRLLQLNAWTEQSMFTLINNLIDYSKQYEYLIVIYDHDQWPESIRLWWSGELKQRLLLHGTRFTFAMSNSRYNESLSTSESLLLKMNERKTRYQKKFVRAKLDTLLDHGYGSVLLGHGPVTGLKNKLVSRATSFEGSLNAVGNYLSSLFQYSLTTPEAIDSRIENSPENEFDFYNQEISKLEVEQPDILTWASSSLSWMMWALRPLRLDELAVANAMKDVRSSFLERISMDVAQDLKKHLSGIVAVENKHGRIDSAVAKGILASKLNRNPHPIDPHMLNLLDHEKLTRVCLAYLESVLTTASNKRTGSTDTRATWSRNISNDLEDGENPNKESSETGETRFLTVSEENWNRILSHVIWKDHKHRDRQPELEFLDYACRFWPAHFLRIENPGNAIVKEVTEFLQTSHGQIWFRIFLHCHGHSTNPLATDGSHVLGEGEQNIRVTEAKSHTSIKTSLEILPESVLNMVCYAGLTSAIPELSEAHGADVELQETIVRRGCSERSVVFPDSVSSYYLDCLIANDDTEMTKKLLICQPTMLLDCYPLHRAALGGSLETVKMLFFFVDDPTAPNEEGRTPLHMAAAGGSTSIILSLMSMLEAEHKLRMWSPSSILNAQDSNGQTPLIIAISMGHQEAAKLLLQKGSDISIRDNVTRTALHYGVLKCPELVERLISPNLVQTRDMDGSTAIHVAAGSGNTLVTALLMSVIKGSNTLGDILAMEDGTGRTPIQRAAQAGHADVVEHILQHKDHMAKENYTLAAELAAAGGLLKTLRCLASSMDQESWNRLVVIAADAGQLLTVLYVLQTTETSPDSCWDGKIPLCQASGRGYIGVVHALLAAGASPNQADEQRKTPLHHAAENAMYEVAGLLLDRQADVNAPDTNRETPLHAAARSGDVSTIGLLIESNAGIEEPSGAGERALHLAVTSPEAVQVLLQAGADANSCDSFGNTPLHFAAQNSCPQSVRHLLDSKADVLVQDDHGHPALYHAIAQDNYEIVREFFLNRGESGNLVRELRWAIDNAASTVFQYLLGLSPQSAAGRGDNDNVRLLHSAAKGKSFKIMELLLQSGIDANIEIDGKKALHVAAKEGCADNVRILLQYDASVDALDESGNTPLHLAARWNRAEAVKVLLDGGADIDAQDSESRTPVFLTAWHGHIKSLEVLLQQEKKPDVTIVSHGSYSEGWAALHASVDNLDATKLLIAAQADPNLAKTDGWTALHLAISWQHAPIVSFLLEHGGNPTLANQDGETALHIAVSRHDMKLVTAILKHGGTVCINERDTAGNTALHLAADCPDCGVEMTQLLIDHGADMTLRTREGNFSLVELAVGSGSRRKLKSLVRPRLPSGGYHKWPLGDLEQAYWRVIHAHCQDVTGGLDMKDSVFPEMLRALVEENRELLKTTSPEEELNALELCLARHGDWCQEQPFAMLLVELGINPLMHNRPSGMSALERAVFSRQRTKDEFLALCVRHIRRSIEDATAQEFGFRELRIAAELDQIDMWRELEPLRNQVADEVDEDGWTLDHFIQQSGGRIPVSVEMPQLTSCETPKRIVLPPKWKSATQDVEDLFKVDNDGLELSFVASPKPVRVSLRADHPFLPRPSSPEDNSVRYFEVFLLAADPTPKTELQDEQNETRTDNSEDDESPIIAIGLCGEFADMSLAHIGWHKWTVGYHSDDGGIFDSQPRRTVRTEYTFGLGSRVGCGVDYSKGEVFFTRDGEIIARHASDVINRKLYPAISHSQGSCKVRVDFELKRLAKGS